MLRPMMSVLAFATAFLGFAALALGMHRHYRQVFHGALRNGPQILLRGLGTVLLTASFAASVTHAGWAIGAVLWLGCLTAAALSIAMALSYGPKSAARP